MNVEKELYKATEDQSAWFRGMTRPLAKLYGAVSAIYHRRFEREGANIQRLEEPVISVGNLTVGGTGKSPVVISLCQYLIERGRKPGVLTRGYGTKLPSPGWMAIRDDQVLFGTVSPPDEAAMEAAALDATPVVIGRDRFVAARAFREKFPEISIDIWVMDDGFQHRKLGRDIDVICADDRLRFGNRQLLPAGPLREPIAAMSRADCLLWTRGTATGRAPAFDTGKGTVPAYTLKFDLGAPIPLDAWYGNATIVEKNTANPAYWIVVCAIAQPERFTNKLLEKGMRIKDSLYFQDHQEISGAKFDRWLQKHSGDEQIALLVTAKDASRNPALLKSLPIPVFVQPLEICNSEVVWDEVLRSYL